MMLAKRNWGRLALAALTGVAIAILMAATPIAVGALTPAQAQVSAEFQAALQPYGSWRRHARWGEVWVPARRPRGWQPYTFGHWVYTDEWGWYWISDREEEDWGWVTYHYGRWVLDRSMGWVWVRGDEWGPAWVNWRRGGDIIGWAPLPPDAVIAEYDAAPAFWVFVLPRNLIAPRVHTYILPPTRTVAILRNTVVVNRTVVVERGHIAVNAGVAPAVVGAAGHVSIQTYRVAPRVLARTQGVAGAVIVKPQDLSRRPGARGLSPFAVTASKTTTVIKPAASVPSPQALGKGDRGHLGTHPPRAAQSSAPPPPTAAPVKPQQRNEPAAPPPQRREPAAAPPPRAPSKPAVNAPEPPPTPPGPPAASGPGEPPPQAKPARPVAPQTPPPPAPSQTETRKPANVSRPPPPSRPLPPAVQNPRRSGDKRDDRN
jgi:hypothetical protein